MHDFEKPDLKFPKMAYGPYETPHNFNILLYRGGAATNIRDAARLIEEGKLGPLIEARAPIIHKLHDIITADISRGLSRQSITQCISSLKDFIKWCDANKREIEPISIEQNYIDWTEHLIFRARIKRDLSEKTIYKDAAQVSFLLSRALDIDLGLLRRTRIPVPNNKRRALGAKTEKQNLEELFEFGNILLDIVNALSAKVINGSLPVEIRFRNGKILTEWCGIRPPERVKHLQDGADPSQRKVVQRARDAWEANPSLRTRYSLLNLRVETELLIFISQTSMNLSQAFKLDRGQFRYQSDGDYIKVFRVYKKRRNGEAQFSMFKEYGKVFRNYATWLDAMFPEEEKRLFPFVYPHKIPRADKAPQFRALKERCKRLGVRHFLPTTLRNTRVNWLLRRSGDPSLTAEMAQHTQQTLFRVYERPNHQLAASEISRYHRLIDPSFAPAPGLCAGPPEKPILITDAPDNAPIPDCGNPAGCLFCSFHRDIDSEDYVWSLVSYRYCKRLELDKYIPNQNLATHPTVSVINRLTAKLQHIESSSEARASWVNEANKRIREGRYHPFLDGTIKLLEAVS